MPRSTYKEQYEALVANADRAAAEARMKYAELEVKYQNVLAVNAGLKQEAAVARTEERMMIAALILRGEGE